MFVIFNYCIWYIDCLPKYSSLSLSSSLKIRYIRYKGISNKRKYYSHSHVKLYKNSFEKILFSIYSSKITILRLRRFSINDQYRCKNFNIFLIGTLWTNRVKTIPQHLLWIRYNGLAARRKWNYLNDGWRKGERKREKRERERRLEVTRESLRDVRLRTIGIKVDARNRWNIRGALKRFLRWKALEKLRVDRSIMEHRKRNKG